MTLYYKPDHVRLYAQARPSMPQTVFEDTISYCKSVGNKFQLVLDVGCGSGQNTPALAEYFTQVIGTDLSHTQITEAKSQHPDINFRVAAAEDLSFAADGSVDLVACFTSFHWFNHEKFYEEIKRVLAPGGVLMACSYNSDIFLDNQEEPDIICKVKSFPICSV